jgi:hypothetical protein
MSSKETKSSEGQYRISVRVFTRLKVRPISSQWLRLTAMRRKYGVVDVVDESKMRLRFGQIKGVAIDRAQVSAGSNDALSGLD